MKLTEHQEEHLSVRIDPRVKQLVFEVARARYECVSDFVRRAVLTELAKLSYLDLGTKKALGIVNESIGLFEGKRAVDSSPRTIETGHVK